MDTDLASQLRRIAAEIETKTASKEGPVETRLKQYWQILHEFESGLSRAITDWKFALSHAKGRKEEKAMKELVKKGEALAKKIDTLARKEVEPVLHLERRVMNMTQGKGPNDYQDFYYNETFPQ
tara:strand:- start:13402 stop:13773 length:372 start_codon:yes stop_codon:yes gene_type:complete